MNDYGYFFHRNYKILTFFAILLNESSSSKLGKWTPILRTASSYLLHCAMAFFTFVDLYLIRNDLEKVLVNLFITGFVGGMLLRNMVYLWYQYPFVELHRQLLDEGHFVQNNDTQLEFTKAISFMRQIDHCFKVIFILVTSGWMLLPFVNWNAEYRLPFRVWFPLDLSDNWSFVIAYLVEMYCMFYIASSILCCDLMAYNILLLIKAHYVILGKNITKINDFLLEEVKSENHSYMSRRLYKMRMKNYLKQLVVHHQQILGFQNKFEEIMYPAMFIQFFGGTYFIGALSSEVMLLTDKVKGNIISKVMSEATLFGGAVLDIFIYCYFGTTLEDLSMDLSFVVYDIKWYCIQEHDSLLKGFIIFVMNQCQRPPKLTAGKLARVNLHTFLSIAQMTYNAIALFRQTMVRAE